MTDPALSATELECLLSLAHAVVTWTTQDTLRPDAAGTPALTAARQAYYRARLVTYARVRELTIADTGGCTCGICTAVDPDCMYHYAAELQPGNHKIPWNCPTYYDGCNCGEPRPGYDQEHERADRDGPAGPCPGA